jgi:hypothetical protein
MDDIAPLEQPTPSARSRTPAESAHIERSVAAAMSALTPLERAAPGAAALRGAIDREIARRFASCASATKHSVFSVRNFEQRRAIAKVNHEEDYTGED